jgi:SAM-dependent methyltransferase
MRIALVGGRDNPHFPAVAYGGIEIEPKAAAEAGKHYDRVYVQDAEAFNPEAFAASFDHVVCADVLEHLRDPWGAVSRLRSVLKPGGQLVASIPNIRNAETVSQLLRGDFAYTDWGIMDVSHLRFFTLKSLRRIFVTAGFDDVRIQPKYDANTERIMALWGRHGVAKRIHDLVLLLGGGPFEPTHEDLMEMLVIQFLVVAGGGGSRP